MNTANWRSAWLSEGSELAELSAISFVLDKERHYVPKRMDVYMYGEFACPGKLMQKCRGKWSSNNCVSVWNYWFDTEHDKGRVELLKEYQQKCKKCENWAYPHFDLEGTEIAVRKLVTRIKSVFYGEAPSGDQSSRHSKAVTRKKPHDSSRCEACRKGACTAGTSFRNQNRRQRDYSSCHREKIQWRVKISDSQCHHQRK